MIKFSVTWKSAKQCYTSLRYAHWCSKSIGELMGTEKDFIQLPFGWRDGGNMQQERYTQVALVVKNPPTNAGDTREVGSIPGLGRFPWRRKLATCSSILAWRIPWTEKPSGLTVHGVPKSWIWPKQLSKGLQGIPRSFYRIGNVCFLG